MPRPDKTPRKLSGGSRVSLIFTGLLIAVGVITVLFPGERPGNLPGALPTFDVQGHRGARGLAPENTLPGFETALAVGVTTLEMDVGMTGDGVLVVSHDRRLNPDRTRGPKGTWLEPSTPTLFDLDFADLAHYDVGRPRPEGTSATRFPEQQSLDGVPIPALADVLARTEHLSGGTMHYNIEIKTSPLAPDETAPPAVIAEALVAALADTEVTGRTTVQAFDWAPLRHVQELAPRSPTVYLTAERPWLDNVERGRPGASPWTAGIDVDAHESSLPRAVKAAGGHVWSPYFRDLREADLWEAHRLGLRVVVWTVNDPADMASLIDLGVDGIITDYPDRLRAVMADKGMPLPPRFPEPGG